MKTIIMLLFVVVTGLQANAQKANKKTAGKKQPSSTNATSRERGYEKMDTMRIVPGDVEQGHINTARPIKEKSKTKKSRTNTKKS